jgi:hypothetical protein
MAKRKKMEKLSATELLLADHGVSEETRSAAARLVRMMGEAHLGGLYDGQDSGVVENACELKSLKDDVD